MPRNREEVASFTVCSLRDAPERIRKGSPVSPLWEAVGKLKSGEAVVVDLAVIKKHTVNGVVTKMNKRKGGGYYSYTGSDNKGVIARR